MLPTRRLGGQGLMVSAIGLGCMGMSHAYGPADEAESIATLHRALDLGCTLLDTAEAYGPFINEDLLGRALMGRREKAVIATKFGFRLQDGRRAGTDSRPEHIRAVAEASLKRLGTDHIDLLYQHRVDPAVPMEDVAGAVDELVREGKVRYFGLSEAGVDAIRRAHAVHPVSAVQSEYSLWERNLEADVLPVLRSLDIGLVPFSPLGRGFLTGKAKSADELPAGDFRAHGDPRFQAQNFASNQHITDLLNDIAMEWAASPAQVALAWVLTRGADIVPIPGARRRSHLEENLAAAMLVLSPEDLHRLNATLDSRPVAGVRYNAHDLSMLNR